MLNDIDYFDTETTTMSKKDTLGRPNTARIQRVKGTKYKQGMDYTQFSSQIFSERPRLHYVESWN